MPRGIPRSREVEAEGYMQPLSDLDPAEPSEIEVVPQIRTPEVELEAFMNEVLTVYCDDSPDLNATPKVEVAVNGRRIFIPRGIETNVGHDEYGRQVPVKRMYIERLARARRTSYRQDMKVTDETMNKLFRHSALEYPFRVVDDSEKGREWLKRIMMQQG